MKYTSETRSLRRKDIFAFAWLTLKSVLNLIRLTVLTPRQRVQLSTKFAELYSKLWDYAEHSISNQGFNLPSALGNGPIHRINALLANLYEGRYASLSFGGSSVIFGRWKAVRLPRALHPEHKTVVPLTFNDVKMAVETYGASRIAAIIIVLPSYDGFKAPGEDQKIYTYAKSHDITVIVDGAWDAARFRQKTPTAPKLETLCDVWVTSLHKRGLTPSSLGCILTHNETIARFWDEALDLGFRSSSISFVEIMIAEHRLEQIISGEWDSDFTQAELSAMRLRKRVKDIHPDLYVVHPQHVQAESSDPAHILINTSQIPNFDARIWANQLSLNFDLDVEKATKSTLLLLCASAVHTRQIDKIILILTKALQMTLSQSNSRNIGAYKNA